MDQMEKSVSCRKRQGRLGLGQCTLAFAWAALLFAMGFAPLAAFAESNLRQNYPEHHCGGRPEPPERPEKFRDRGELDAYNEKVHAYNAAMEQYVNCLQRYVDNAASDIRAIREKIEAALEAVKP